MKRARNTKESDSMLLWRCIRRRRVEQPNRRSISDLPDHLLQEILVRLGCPITAVRCKSVCKLWYSLISSPDFRVDSSLAFFVNLPVPGEPFNDPLCASGTSYLRRWSGFKLNNLSCFDGFSPIGVLGSYKDVLLCTQRIRSQWEFFVVNPFTMHWIHLPHPLSSNRHNCVPVGLAVKECPDEPPGYKFRAVRIIRTVDSDRFWAQVFDPNRNHWIELLVHQPHYLGWVPNVSQGLVYKGALHWLVTDGPVVAYDPFTPPDTNGTYLCRFIMRSDEMRCKGDANMVIEECITVSEEHIRLVQLTFPKLLKQGNEAAYLTVWKLENYEEGRWVLEHRVYFKDMIFKGCAGDSWYRLLKRREIQHWPKPVACHPNNSHIVYLYFPGSIVSCNLSTKILKVVSRIDEQTKHYMVDVVPFLISLQPTAVPRRSESLRSFISFMHQLGYGV